MEEFLEEREDLVVIFFTKVDFEYHDYKALQIGRASCRERV